jgi:hypothetical protein
MSTLFCLWAAKCLATTDGGRVILMPVVPTM